jgi:hypothetical protein
MNLLKYEFDKSSPDGSYNGMLRSLVTKVRYHRNNVSAEYFKAAIPEMLEIETNLQNFDKQIDIPNRNYLQEILDELDAESRIEPGFFEEIETACLALVRDTLEGNLFSLNNYSLIFKKIDNYFVVLFLGYQDGVEQPKGEILIVREILRSLSNKYDIIFIDLSN